MRMIRFSVLPFSLVWWFVFLLQDLRFGFRTVWIVSFTALYAHLLVRGLEMGRVVFGRWWL